MRRCTGSPQVLLVVVVSCLVVSATGAAGRHVCTEEGCWPLTWLLGCQKCGSTSLAKVMHKTRLACYANVTGVNEGKPSFFSKETHFWDESREGIVLDPNQFVELYPEVWSGQCDSFIEATPNNLAYIEVAAAVFHSMPVKALSMVKLVVVLREPIARHLSLYNHQRVANLDWSWSCPASKLDTYEEYARCELEIWRDIFRNETATIGAVDDEKLARVRYGLGYSSTWGGIYAPQIKEWTTYFPRKEFLILHFDDITGTDSVAFFAIVRGFLEGKQVPSAPKKHAKPLPHTNAQASPEKSQVGISCTTLNDVNLEIYDRWNEKLYAMLDEDHREQRAPLCEPVFRRFEPYSACY